MIRAEDALNLTLDAIKKSDEYKQTLVARFFSNFDDSAIKEAAKSRRTSVRIILPDEYSEAKSEIMKEFESYGYRWGMPDCQSGGRRGAFLIFWDRGNSNEQEA